MKRRPSHAPFFAIIVLFAAGCSDARDTNIVRDRANAQCAEIVGEMRADLREFYERAQGLAGDDAPLRQLVENSTQTEPFRNPNPCFGFPSQASDAPEGFRLELEASLSGLRATFTNAGRLPEYEALEDARVRAQILERIAQVRTLADEVAQSE